MHVGASGATSVQSLEGSEMVLGMGPLEMATALTTSGLDHLQLAVERVYLCRDIEDTSVHFVVAGDLGGQPPVVRAASQLHGLMVGGRLPRDGVDEPHWEWLSGGITDVGGGGV